VRWKFVPVEQGSTQRLIKSITCSIGQKKKVSNDPKDLPGTEKLMLLSHAGQSILEDSRSQNKN